MILDNVETTRQPEQEQAKTPKQVIDQHFDQVLESRPDLTEATGQLFQRLGEKFPNRIELMEQAEPFLKLVDILLTIENQPKNREGARQKAEFCVELLQAGNVAAEIVEVEGIDPDGNPQTLYNVVARAGTSKTTENQVNGMMLVHHDTVTKKTEELHAQFDQNSDSLVHPWVLDDTIHTAAALQEMLNFQQAVQKGEVKAAQVTLVVSDWEEMNCQGMRGLLKHWKDGNQLPPAMDFIIDGESNGSTPTSQAEGVNLAEIGVGMAYRGKGVRTVETSIGPELSTFAATRDLIKKLRELQRTTYELAIQSRDPNADPNTQANPTAIAATFATVTTERAFAYLEMRTNSGCPVDQSAAHTEAVFARGIPAPEFELPPDLIEIEHLDQVYSSQVDGQNGRQLIFVKLGENQHPGKYEPLTRQDGLSATELFLAYLTPEEQAQLIQVNLGSKDRPNSVPATATLEFSEALNLAEVLGRIKADQANWDDQVAALSQTEQPLRWQVHPTDTPDRECLPLAAKTPALARATQDSIAAAIQELTDEEVVAQQVPTTPFNAMVDAGAITTDPAFQAALLPEGSTVLVVGSGSFNDLHSNNEAISPNTVVLAMAQYRNLLRNLVTHLQAT